VHPRDAADRGSRSRFAGLPRIHLHGWLEQFSYSVDRSLIRAMRVNRPNSRSPTTTTTVQAGTVFTGTTEELMRRWEEALWLGPDKTRSARTHLQQERHQDAGLIVGTGKPQGTRGDT